MENNVFQSEKGFYCEINQRYYPSLRGLLNYIRTQSITSEQYYLKYLGNKTYCEVCGNDTSFDTIKVGYKRFCSDTCACRSEGKRKIVSQRFVGNEKKLLDSLEKRRKTLSTFTKEERQQWKEKTNQTIIDRYGEDYRSNRTKKQWERRTLEEVKQLVLKSNQTKLKNGTLSLEPYKHTNKQVLLNGKLFKVQGYEDIALKLLSELIDVEIINVGKDVPRIHLSTGKIYYPDINVNKLLIEVKSEYTYSVKLEDNLLKQKESIQKGFGHIFLVIHSRHINKKTREVNPKHKQKYIDILNKAISSQASFEEGSTTIP